MPMGGMLPYGPQGGGAAAGGSPLGPLAAIAQQKEPIQEAGETAITQLLQMATSNPMLLIGLSMAGAAREISQLTGMSRRRGSGTAGQGAAGAAPSAATMLGGSMGDIDRMVALQTMMGGGAPPGGPPMGAPPGGPPPGMPPMPPGGAPPMPPPGGGNPLAALLGGAGGPMIPPQFTGLV